ncbi:MAG: chemotaxis protein CheX [Planctomycetes bacterium]|nr:chemotaxis protein CheX [Planctomycetota bacterium]
MSAERTIADALKAGTLTRCERELLVHLEAAVDNVFTTMLSTVCELVEATSAEACAQEDARLASVAIEAIVEFEGPTAGAVVLRCSPEGAADIARGLLTLGAGDSIELAEVHDALGECANMVTGAFKTRALDPHGAFRLTVPKIDTHVVVQHPHQAGRLVYELAEGSAAVEVWFH